MNGHTNRLRLYFADLKHGKWEFLGGQTWSWLTPNRNGIGPMPVDLALTYNEDQSLGAPGSPKDAHLSMVYFGVRYVLPSTSGTLARVPQPN